MSSVGEEELVANGGQLRVGSRWSSTVCTTQVVVLTAGREVGAVACGGSPMVPGDQAPAPDARPDRKLVGGAVLGKRYRTDDGALEMLCVKAGVGTLTVDGVPLQLSAPARLPASD